MFICSVKNFCLVQIQLTTGKGKNEVVIPLSSWRPTGLQDVPFHLRKLLSESYFVDSLLFHSSYRTSQF